MLRRETAYIYTPIDGSDEKVGELLTDVITEADLQHVDSSDRKQTTEVAAVIDDFGSDRSIPQEPLELARMVVANRVYGWLPPKNDMLTEWEAAHKGYTVLNNGTPTPAVALAVRERHPEEKQPYGYYMSINEAEALMLNFLRMKSPALHTPTLRMNYDGYGTRFYDHGRVLPSALGDLSQPLPYMLLRSGEEQQPLSVDAREQFGDKRLRSSLHFALGKQAVLAIPDHLKATGRFSDETILEEMGRMGIAVRHTDLYANHDFNAAEREEKTQELKQQLMKALLLSGSMLMPHEVRRQIALYDIDAPRLATDVQRDFEVVDAILPSIRKDNAERFQARTSHTKYTLPGDDRLNGVSIELAAWQRDIDGYDKELVEYALANRELF